MRVIVTRPEDDAGPLAAKLQVLGHEVISAPLLIIRPRPGLALPDRPYQASLVTSANALRALAGRRGMADLAGRPVFAVGPASAAAARGLGFARVEEAAGDLASLLDLVRSRLTPAGGPLLYLSGAVTAGDLAGSLRKFGFTVDRLVAYDAVPAESLPPACTAAVAHGLADAVLLFSPRTAAIWAGLVAAGGLVAAARGLLHYCLSTNVVACLTGILGEDVAVRVPGRPNEAALLELLGPAA